MFKKIDFYIFKKFLGTFFFSITLIIVIVIIFDISEKIEDFISKQAPLKAIVFDYYLNFIPYFVNLFSPLFTFIAVIFFTSRMASQTEIVAILSSGISFRRMMLPYFFASCVLALLSLYLNNFLIPSTNKIRLNFENKYINNPYRNDNIHIHRQVSPGNFIYMERFETLEKIGYKFSYEKFKDGKLYYKLMSELIRWDTITNKWRIENYFIRRLNNKGETIQKGTNIDTTYNFTPSDFSKRINNVETLNYKELNKFIVEEKMKGAGNIEFYEIEKYRRIATPFSTFILALIGVSLASRKVRGGIGLHIGLGILISFSYILFMQISTTFATGGLVSPLIAVWIPNVLYLFLGFYLYAKAPK